LIFTAYFDEADTHGPMPRVVMASFLGHAYQWQRFEIRLKRLQAQYRFRIFHGKDFKARTREFSGWDDEKSRRLVEDLADLAQDTLTDGFAVALERERYLNEYRTAPIPAKMNVDSQYGACFRACMGHLFDIMAERGYRDMLHVVMESGHPNVWDCERIFNDLKKICRDSGFDFLGTFSVADKNDAPPLMAADLLAGTYSAMKTLAETRFRDIGEAAPPPRRGKARLTYLELRKDALMNLKIQFERNRQKRIAEWRRKREARRASSSVKVRPS
jgi:hypothetical protein